MMLRDYVHRGWAKRAWKSGYDWAVRPRLKPIKRVSSLIKDYWNGVVNVEIPVGALDRLVRATADTRRLLGAAAEGMGLSVRAARRLLRVARTVADLAQEEKTGPQALAEALRYRATGSGSTSGAELREAAANRFTVALRSQRCVRNLTPAVRELSPDSEKASS
jgi:hypothetical protein